MCTRFMTKTRRSWNAGRIWVSTPQNSAYRSGTATVVFLKLIVMVRLGRQVANVKHSHCEAKFGFRVWETKFGRIHCKTAPIGPGGEDGGRYYAGKLF